MQGQCPIDVTGVVDLHPGLEVDEHSITICRYASGLSRMETRWGTFTDPWHHQTQPPCGFTLLGSEGTIQSNDYGKTVRLQNAKHPAGLDIQIDELVAPHRNPIEYVLDCLTREVDIEGPLSESISWIGQRIVDTAFRSAELQKTLPLINFP
jgi:glucose-fructose oxidoreductase